MILRRLVEHLKQQHWTAIGIELVIVVVGVFIGLQVNNWNEARRDRAIEHEYLQRIYDDMQATIAEYDGVTAAWNATRYRDQAIVLNDLRSGDLPARDRAEFDRGLWLFGYVSGPSVRWTTVEELQSTGSMAVIQDLALRSQIGALDAEVRRREGISLTLTGSINAYRQQIGSRFAVLEVQGYEGATLQYDFPALAADPAFVNILSQIDALGRLKVDLQVKLLVDVRKLRDELAKRLGRPPGDAP